MSHNYNQVTLVGKFMGFTMGFCNAPGLKMFKLSIFREGKEGQEGKKDEIDCLCNFKNQKYEPFVTQSILVHGRIQIKKIEDKWHTYVLVQNFQTISSEKKGSD